MTRSTTQQVKTLRLRVLRNIVRKWSLAGVKYGVLHGLEKYPGVLGRDLDVIVNPENVEMAVKLAVSGFIECGWTPVLHRKPWALWITAFAMEKGEVFSTELDILWDLRWGWAQLARGVSPALYTVEGFIVDAWGSFVKQVLMNVLSRRNLLMARLVHDYLESLPDQEAGLSVVVRQKLAELVGEDGLVLLQSAIVPNRAEFCAKRLRAKLLWRHLLLKPLLSVRLLLNWIRDEVALYIFPNRAAPIIAIVGPDGVGKTTLLEAVKKSVGDTMTFTDVRIRHWRPGVLPPYHTGDRTTGPRRTVGWGYWFRVFYYCIDMIVRYIFQDCPDAALLRLVLYDRYLLDAVVDPSRYGLSATKGLKLLWRVLPRPDMVVLLYDAPERIHRRGTELSTKEIRRQLVQWVAMAVEGHVDAIFVGGSLTQRLKWAKELIGEAFIERGQEINLVSDDCGSWVHRVFPVADGKEGFESREQFFLLRLPDGREYLLPSYSRKTAEASLDLYRALGWKAKALSRLLRYGLRMGLIQAFLPKVSLDFGEIVQVLRSVFGDIDHLVYALSLGTPGPHRKPVLQVMSETGRVLGYVKIGWNPLTRGMVSNEAYALRTLKRFELRRLVLPDVLWFGEIRSWLILATRPNGLQTPQRPLSLDAALVDCIEEITLLLQRKELFRHSPFRETLRDRIRALDGVVPCYQLDVLRKSLKFLEMHLNNELLPWAWRLGDFTPWNSTVEDRTKRVHVVDLECALPEWLPGWDLFHFVTSTRGPFYFANMQTDEEQRIRLFLESIDVDPHLIRPLYVSYLVDLFTSWAETWREAKRFVPARERKRFRRLVTAIAYYMLSPNGGSWQTR